MQAPSQPISTCFKKTFYEDWLLKIEFFCDVYWTSKFLDKALALTYPDFGTGQLVCDLYPNERKNKHVEVIF